MLGPAAQPEAPDVRLQRLRGALAQQGLHIVLPLTPAALLRAGLDLALADLLPGGRAGLIIGDGGGEFFARFQADRDAPAVQPDPLDHYTARVIPAALAAALGPGAAFAVCYPFGRQGSVLPFQQLGQAAGLPAAGPLGVQVHPRFGPWWGYRALAVLADPLPEEAALPSPCVGCPAPCVAVCPANALAGGQLNITRCASHRLQQVACQGACAARQACVQGPEHRYPDAQLQFHMAASMRMVRAYFGRGGAGSSGPG